VNPYVRTRLSADPVAPESASHPVATAAEHDHALENRSPVPNFDVVIIGSGYGASVAAASFAKLSADLRANGQDGLSVCVLERGNERLPGSFPDSFPLIAGETLLTPLRQESQPDVTPTQAPQDQQTNPSRQIGVRDGLYEVRAGTDVAAVVASGLGGGSLINAGVMLKPTADIFANQVWPAVLRSQPTGDADSPHKKDELDPYFERSLQLLGASISSASNWNEYEGNTVEHAQIRLKKFDALKSLSGQGEDFHAVPITVRLDKEHSVETVRTEPCIQCGDCATGCNYGAKKSLDTNLLAQAALNGAQVFTGATVQRFDRGEDDAYRVFIWHTGSKLRDRRELPVEITCSKLVVAAGTFGSTELMFRSQAMSEGRLKFSEKLGSRFSGNGDNIAAVTSDTVVANDVALPTIAPIKRRVGPTITGMIDQRVSGPKQGSVPIAIQELSIPAPLYRFFRMAVSYSRTVDLLSDTEQAKAQRIDHLLSWRPLDNTQTNIVALMGGDPRQATFDYHLDADSGTERLGLTWNPADLNGSPFVNKEEANQFYTGQVASLRKLAGESAGTRVFPNPLTKPLGTGVFDEIFDVPDGPHLTVHPLGGG
jgi:choline dehydrogenase-like flavoprotein